MKLLTDKQVTKLKGLIDEIADGAFTPAEAKSADRNLDKAMSILDGAVVKLYKKFPNLQENW